MTLSFILWFDLVVALSIGLLMFIDYRRYRIVTFKQLMAVFLISAVKSAALIAIGFFNVDLMTVTSGATTSVQINPAKYPLYQLNYFIFQYLDIIYALGICHLFLYARKTAEEHSTKSARTAMWIQGVIATLIALFVAGTSWLQGNPETFVTTNRVVEFLKTSIVSRSLLAAWKIAILITTWIIIASIYGYIANILKTIYRYKKRLVAILIVEMAFTFIAVLSPDLILTQPTWFVVRAAFFVLFMVAFAFANHTDYIESIQDRVVSLVKEKDMIVTLMKEISAIVGSGDIEQDIVIRKIVEDSVKGTGARGGAALLKDPITNRLIVKHVNGLYPPTKTIKVTAGLTLTESIIVGKFQSEKIAVGEGYLGKVAEKGEPIFIPDISKDPNFEQTLPDYIKVQSFIAVPLKSKDDIFGVLTVIDDSKLFQENDLSLLETLGEQAAITIKQLQMYQQVLEKKQAEKEISVAAEIQSSLIPHTFPNAERYDIYGFSIPAKGVGGDYYDYIDFSNNKIALTMFDVSGKGVPASLIMVMIRSILRTIASLNQDTREVLIKLNDTIAGEIVEDRYATGYYLLFDAEKGIMSYTNAGHGPLMLYRSNQDNFEFLDTDGMPVGIMSGVEYGQNYTILEKGDIAVLYTDGITEAMNMAHEEFGMERFKEVIRKYKRETARDIANKILEAVTSFAGAAPQHDDETLLVLKYK